MATIAASVTTSVVECASIKRVTTKDAVQKDARMMHMADAGNVQP